MATASSRNCAHEFEANYPVECHRLARLNKHPAAIELELEWDIVEMHWGSKPHHLPYARFVLGLALLVLALRA